MAEKKSAGKNRTAVKTTAKRHRKKQNPTVKGLIDGSVFVLVVLVCTFLVLTFVTQRTRVTGTSMETTLYDGDNIMMDKLSYRFRPVRRNEVICFVSKRDNETLIKRVIGLPGETVRISSGTIYINDEPINDYIGGISFAGRAEDGITLEKNEMSISYWEITGWTASIPVTRRSETFVRRIFSEEPSFCFTRFSGYGL